MDDFDTMLTGMSNFVNKKAAHYWSAALGGRNVKVFKGLKYGFDTNSVTRREVIQIERFTAVYTQKIVRRNIKKMTKLNNGLC